VIRLELVTRISVMLKVRQLSYFAISMILILLFKFTLARNLLKYLTKFTELSINCVNNTAFKRLKLSAKLTWLLVD